MDIPTNRYSQPADSRKITLITTTPAVTPPALPSPAVNAPMYERFTDRARKVMQLANEEAQSFNHEYIGTEHLLLALSKGASGVAAEVLKSFDLDVRTLYRQVEKFVQRGPEMVLTGNLPQTPRTKNAIQFAAEEANQFRHDYIGTEHLLLGLLREREGVAAQVLLDLGLTLAEVRGRTLQLLGWPISVGENETAPVAKEKRLDRMADKTRAALQLAHREAERLNHNYVGTEHILLGVVRQKQNLAVAILNELGVEAQHIIDEIEASLPRRPESPPRAGESRQTPRAKRAIDLAIDEAKSLDNDYIGTEHLLLGLLREGEGLAGQVLAKLGVTLEKSREGLAAIMNSVRDEVLATPQGGSVMRVLDAAGNRAAEAVRVVEDYVRFVLDDRHLMERAKHFRHDLTAILDDLPRDLRFGARDTSADVGTDVKTARELRRNELSDIVAANMRRLFEALRSLEEFSKLPSPALAAKFERLRYRAYELERAIGITAASIERLAGARLYVLLDGRASEAEFSRLVEALVHGGVHAVQLRDKTLTDGELLARARILRKRTEGTETLFIMNDRPDLAALSHADGVHVGQEELSVKDARAIVGPRALIGVSTHSIEQARQAVLDGANYIGVGPVFRSETKHFSQLPGVELVRAVAAEIKLPAYAIGGITLDNLGEALAAGATRVAVCGAIVNAANPDAAAREFLLNLFPRAAGP